MATAPFQPASARPSQSEGRCPAQTAGSRHCSRLCVVTSLRLLRMDRSHTLEYSDYERRGNRNICREILSQRRCCSPQRDRRARRILQPSSATPVPD
jgi:hypothetical protein